MIGRDYPFPMVNHAVVSRNNMERLRQVYQRLYKYRDTSKQRNLKKLKYSITLYLDINQSYLIRHLVAYNIINKLL